MTTSYHTPLSAVDLEAVLNSLSSGLNGSISRPWTNPEKSPKQPDKKPMSAVDFLKQVESTLISRGKEYDRPEGERSMKNAVDAFNAITGYNLSESDGWFFMECLKNSRQYQTEKYHHDSALDAVAYSALKAEALAAGK